MTGNEATHGAGSTEQRGSHAPEGKQPPGRIGAMALLEVLRAPLLLSPVADVAAGWAVATALIGSTADGPTTGASLALVAAAACGVCLLGAGMAQNALVDRADDAARKPDRPLPRGAVTVSMVTGTFVLLTLGALGASLAVPGTLYVALAIVALTAAYHTVLKSQRLAGCLALGALRGLDMLLGATAATGGFGALLDLPAVAFSPLVACGAYALYIAGASLHASTDDESGGAIWSRAGLSLDILVLVGLGQVASSAPDAVSPSTLVFAVAIIRLAIAWRRLPAPMITGVALSNMYLLGAGVCYGAGKVTVGTAVLALFVCSRLLMRRFPPS